jgi:hypothetical protein
MKKRYEDGGEIDAMEAANKSEEAMDIADSLKRGAPGTSETVRAKPKAKPEMSQFGKPKTDMSGYKPRRSADMPMPSGSPGRGKSAEMPADVTKMSLADRAKRSREMARSGSGTTDTRSVSERIKSAFGMKSGGKVSASSRADGIAQRGKTRGKMC